MKFIRRNDGDTGWIVNIKTKADRFNRYFYDKICSGKSFSKLAAMSYRDRIAKQEGLLLDKKLKKQPYDKDRTGWYVKEVTDDAGRVYTYAIAYWTETDDRPRFRRKRVRKYKKFSFNKHGIQKAKKLAKEFSENKIKELYR